MASKGSSKAPRVMASEGKTVSNKGMNRILDKGGPHKSASVNKSIRMGAGIGPSGKPR